MSNTVSEIMTTPVLTVDPETNLDEIADAMLAEEIKSIAAIDEDCNPVGILTSTDFIEVVSNGHAGSDHTVGEYMTTELVTAEQGISIPEAAATMVEHGISHLPVTDGSGVIGIVTATDIAEYVGRDQI